MNILITGINGFVGCNFVENWKDNHAIYGLDILSKDKDGIIQTYPWDSFDKLPSVDAIVHLAGKAHDTKNQSLAQSYFDINTGLTQKIFDYFLQSETKTFIFFSSVKAAADSISGDILTEEVEPKPIGPYGESKIKAEEYILANSRQPTANSKHIYILRPAMIHGPGNKGNLNLLYQVLRKGIPWPLGAYENKRSFCSIDNITYVVEQLIVRENTESGIYHVCDDKALSTNEIVRLISKSSGKKPRIWNIPQKSVNSLARIGDLLHLPLNTERLKKLTENYVVSNQKIKNALGISEMPMSAKDGMSRTFESFR